MYKYGPLGPCSKNVPSLSDALMHCNAALANEIEREANMMPLPPVSKQGKDVAV